MIEINLFPWREYRRARLRWQLYISTIGVVIGTCIIIVTLMCSNIKKTRNQWGINDFYQQWVAKLKHELKTQQNNNKLRDKLLKRLQIFEKVNNNQTLVIHFINGMAHVLPNRSYYTSISFSHDQFLLEGRAHSENQLSSILKNIKSENWRLQSEDSKIIERVEHDVFYVRFRLQIMIM